jgi:hypothetical protein
MPVLTIGEAAEAAKRAFEGDPTIDSIVFEVPCDTRFPTYTGRAFAAFHHDNAWFQPVTLHGVYGSDEAAAMNVAQRGAL